MTIKLKKGEFAKDYAKRYVDYTFDVVSKISPIEIETFVQTLLAAQNRGSSIYFIGNGGSASTASHFANDLAIGSCSWDKPFIAYSLCDNQSICTAISNDYSFDEIFAIQLSLCLQADDVLVAISASGNSINLLKAIDVAKKRKAISFGLTAFDGGKLRKLADHCVHVPTDIGDYGPAEDAHLILNHLVATYIKQYVGGKKYSGG